MRRRDITLSIVLLLFALLNLVTHAGAAQYPARPISIIVCFPAGGGADVATRTVSKYAAKELGQNINIINVTGGNGAVGYLQAASAKPDGYTLVNLQVDIWSLEVQKLAPISRDNFQPIAAFAYQPAAIITRTDSQWKTFDEFVAKVKQSPGKYNVGGSPLRGIFHQASVLLSDKAGIKYNYVPTGGAPETLTALVGGQVDTALTWASTAKGQIQAGKMRALAIFADRRSEDMPDVPTLKELGIDITYGGFYGLGAPKGIAPEVAKTLEAAYTKAFKSPELGAELKKLGLEPMFLNAAEFKTFLDQGVEKVRTVVKLIEPAR